MGGWDGVFNKDEVENKLPGLKEPQRKTIRKPKIFKGQVVDRDVRLPNISNGSGNERLPNLNKRTGKKMRGPLVPE